MVKLVNTLDLKSSGINALPVRFRPVAPTYQHTMQKINHKKYAPVCVHPNCARLVDYHRMSTYKDDKTWRPKWKSFCELHRTVLRPEADAFKKSRGGCENRNAIYGFPCGDPDTPSLEIDHYDGNKYNNDQDNLLVVCANCHRRKTKMFGDTTRKYFCYNDNFDNFFEAC